MVFNEKSEVLIAEREPASNNEVGLWDFPGGTVEFGESIEDTVIRELKEEVDIDIELVELLNVVNHILPKEGQHWVSPVYIAKHIGGIAKVLEPEKCPKFEWLKIENLNPKILTESSRQSYEAYLEKYA